VHMEVLNVMCSRHVTCGVSCAGAKCHVQVPSVMCRCHMLCFCVNCHVQVSSVMCSRYVSCAGDVSAGTCMC